MCVGIYGPGAVWCGWYPGPGTPSGAQLQIQRGRGRGYIDYIDIDYRASERRRRRTRHSRERRVARCYCYCRGTSAKARTEKKEAEKASSRMRKAPCSLGFTLPRHSHSRQKTAVSRPPARVRDRNRTPKTPPVTFDKLKDPMGTGARPPQHKCRAGDSWWWSATHCATQIRGTMQHPKADNKYKRGPARRARTRRAERCTAIQYTPQGVHNPNTGQGGEGTKRRSREGTLVHALTNATATCAYLIACRAASCCFPAPPHSLACRSWTRRRLRAMGWARVIRRPGNLEGGAQAVWDARSCAQRAAEERGCRRTCRLRLRRVRVLPAHVSEEEIVELLYPLQVLLLVRRILQALRVGHTTRRGK